MKVSIRNQQLNQKIEPEMDLYLAEDNGVVSLFGYDASGHRWWIAEFGDGGMKMIAGIPVSTGWPLDPYNQLVVCNER
jgi:hypothetical protein